METVPDDVELHVLPSGATDSPNISIGQARSNRMRERMDAAHAASGAYLRAVAGP
jgi:NTE family protein